MYVDKLLNWPYIYDMLSKLIHSYMRFTNKMHIFVMLQMCFLHYGKMIKNVLFNKTKNTTGSSVRFFINFICLLLDVCANFL